MEIKEQPQVFITVPYYFRMQVQKEAADIKADIGCYKTVFLRDMSKA